MQYLSRTFFYLNLLFCSILFRPYDVHKGAHLIFDHYLSFLDAYILDAYRLASRRGGGGPSPDLF